MAGYTATLQIDSIAAGGDGVARLDGMAVFVPRTAPGDQVVARVMPKGRFARARLQHVEVASPERIDPACEHYVRDRCGGCQLQHLSYEAQLGAKQRIVLDAMQRIAKIPMASMPTVFASEKPWRYRSKLTLALRRMGSGWIAGLHAYDDPDYVFSLKDCPITQEPVVQAWYDIMQASKFFPPVARFRASVRWTEDGAVFVVYDVHPWPAAQKFFDAVPSLAAMAIESAGHRTVVGDRRSAEASVLRPLAAFTQVNPVVAARIGEYVQERVLSANPRYVVDAYSGHGDLAAALVSTGVRVTAIELDPDGASFAAARLPHGSRSIQGKVEDVLASTLPADTLVVNPPRAGLHDSVPALLNSAGPDTITYVSCNPATLARDIARLHAYRVAAVRAFDMFPQTAHVETVCSLVRDTDGYIPPVTDSHS